MARFGKIVNNEVEWAPSEKQNDKQWCYQNKYQPVIETAQPADFDEYEYTYSWKNERKTFIKVWSRGEKKPDLRPNIEKREEAYETRLCVEFDTDVMLTVDEAAKRLYQYEAEGRDMQWLKEKIKAAKQAIREEFPDENKEA